ncbi:hypothetical protein MGSAQ_002360, partial [marine sediment metagenome]
CPWPRWIWPRRQPDLPRPDETRWPALRLAREVMAAGGAGAVFNAAKEQALDDFIAGRIRLPTCPPGSKPR